MCGSHSVFFEQDGGGGYGWKDKTEFLKIRNTHSLKKNTKNSLFKRSLCMLNGSKMCSHSFRLLKLQVSISDILPNPSPSFPYINLAKCPV